MTIGPDGAIWLTDGGIGRVTTGGAFTQFSTGNYSAYGITTGSDGNLWFSGTDFTTGGGVIARMTTSGSISAFHLASGLVIKAGTIATGSDGAVWFAAEGSSGTAQASIGRITTAGAITMFGVPVSGNAIVSRRPSVAAGSDGALWFTGERRDRADHDQRERGGVSVQRAGSTDCRRVGWGHVVHGPAGPDAVARGGDGSSTIGSGHFADYAEYDCGE